VKWRLVAVLLALTTLVLLVQDIPLAAYLRTIESNRIITELQRDAFLLAGRSEDALQSGTALNDAELNAVVTAYGRSKGADVAVVDAEGILVASSTSELQVGRSFESRPEIQQALAGQTASGERESNTLGTRLLYVAVPVLSGRDTLGAVRLTYPAAELDKRVNDRVKGIGIVALLTLVAAAVVAFLLAGTITRPLRRLQATTAELASGDLTARADMTAGAPELRSLARDLNTMADRLDSLIEAQRSFASDASHQLRTPLTALQLRLDQAAEALPGHPEAAAEPLESARTETERLQLLIEGLLHLARAEGAKPQLVAMDLEAVAGDRIAMWEPLAEERGISIRTLAAEGAAILAFPGAPEQILDNYLDNAISFSPAGSTVTVAIDVDRKAPANSTTLRVIDHGPGLAPDKRARAFDRFWRDRDGNAGTGLGLAIVSQLADACDASVELRESNGGGTEAVAIFRRP